MSDKQQRSSDGREIALGSGDVSELFRAAFSGVRLRNHSYRPEISAPSSPTLGDDTQAQQPIVLVPEQSEGSALVVGFANRLKGLAELKTFDAIDAAHRRRFHTSVPLNLVDYNTFLLQALDLLKRAGFAAQIAPQRRTVAKSPPKPIAEEPTTVGSSGLLIGMAAVLIPALAAGGLMLHWGFGLKHEQERTFRRSTELQAQVWKLEDDVREFTESQNARLADQRAQRAQLADLHEQLAAAQAEAQQLRNQLAATQARVDEAKKKTKPAKPDCEANGSCSATPAEPPTPSTPTAPEPQSETPPSLPADTSQDTVNQEAVSP